jgi:aspartyl-tRNA(Asn)/glutamyl-tRNA(Gln) amidotransferase subunit A
VTEEPLTIAAAGDKLRRGELTCVDLTASHLERIAVLDPTLRAFIEVTGDEALQQAASLDSELASGVDRGPLHGIPISIKDLFDVAGAHTTAGSRSRAHAGPAAADAAVVARLRTAGAVFLGKNNLAEFAADMTGRNETYGDMRNPWNDDFSAGGSSGGTASAVASGMCMAGVGTDTGGSIRFPASVCGVVGVRPTYGTVDLEGAFARAPTLDVAGPIARTVDDAAALLSVMTGRSVTERVRWAPGLEGVRIGLIDNVSLSSLEPNVERSVRQTMDVLAKIGAEVRSVAIPEFGTVLEPCRLLDVLMYEFHEAMAKLPQSACQPRLLGPIVRDNLDRGAEVRRDFYELALADRAALRSRVRDIFDAVDVLATPTLPAGPLRFSAGSDELEQVRRFLLPISYLGLPCVSVPCGKSDNGLPVGLQVIGGYHDEATMLRVARAVEFLIGWQCLPAQREAIR